METAGSPRSAAAPAELEEEEGESEEEAEGAEEEAIPEEAAQRNPLHQPAAGPPARGISDIEAVATARLRGLDAQARSEVRDAAQRILFYGLGCLTPELLLSELNASPSSPGSGAPGGNVWRNVHYGEPDARRLPVYEELGVQKDPLGSLPFGERLVVADEADLGTQLWVRLADGPFTGKWVLARSERTCGAVVNCVRMSDWVRKRGAIPQTAYRGQGYPEVGMCTKGYAGSSDVCLVSAASGSLWRSLHVETLFRDVATATVREDHWAGETQFAERIVHFATNCAQYGQLRTRRPKRLAVVVRHSPRWRNYQHGMKVGPKLASIKEDVDEMQLKECTWLHSGAQGLELKWSSVEFLTALEFLRSYCAWGEADCRRAANEKLIGLLESYHTLSSEECRSGLESAFWCWDEAFQSEELEVSELGARESVCQLLWELAEVQEMRQGLELGPLKAASDSVQDSGSWAGSLGAQVWGQLLAPARAAAEAAGLQVYVVGGCSSACLNTADRMSPGKGSWATTPAAPTRRSHHAAAVLKGCLYVLGGRDGNGSFLASVDSFDAERHSWTAAAPLATARAGLAATALGGLLYAVGGWNGRCHLAVVECLDPATKMKEWRLVPSLRTARNGLAATGCPGAGLFALGGEGPKPLAAAERFSPGMGAWADLPPMATARSGLAAAVLGGGLYAVGGFDGENALAAVERFDLAEGTWSEAAEPGLPTPRHGLAAVALAGALYVLGGRDAKYSALDVVERYDPVDLTWRSMPPMPAPRGYLAAGVLADCHSQADSCGSCFMH